MLIIKELKYFLSQFCDLFLLYNIILSIILSDCKIKCVKYVPPTVVAIFTYEDRTKFTRTTYTANTKNSVGRPRHDGRTAQDQDG